MVLSLRCTQLANAKSAISLGATALVVIVLVIIVGVGVYFNTTFEATRTIINTSSNNPVTNSNPSSTNHATAINTVLYQLSFIQAVVCGPGASLYGDYFIPWSVTLTSNSSFNATIVQPPNSNLSNGYTSTKNESYASISFSVPNGTYNYTLNPVNDVVNSQTWASSGTIKINGSEVTVYVEFNLLTCGSAVTATTLGSTNGTYTQSSPPGWTQGGVARLVLTSPNVLSYVKPAYSYDLNIVQDTFATNLANALINVTESQSVSGNWTDGYQVTYSGLMLNATVQLTPSDSYQLISLEVTNLPNKTYSIGYNSQQQHIIQVALSNSTVDSLVSNFTKYYVNEVSGLVGNGTDFYYLSISQVDGPKAVSVYVNAAMTAVISATSGYNGGGVCFYNPYFCYTVPWNSTGG